MALIEKRKNGKFSVIDILFILAAFIIVVAGIRAASALLIPFLIAAFIAMIINPFYFWLQQKGISSGLSLIVIFFILIVSGFLGAVQIGRSINSFSEKLPTYQKQLSSQGSEFFEWLAEKGITVPEDAIDSNEISRYVFGFMMSMFGEMSQQLGQTFIIMLIVIFILLEAAILPDKIKALPNLTEDSWDRMTQIVNNVRRYMAMKALMSFLTGLLIYIMCILYGINSALLLGVLAFILNFIPNIGSFIAGIPGVLIAFLDYGVGWAVITTVSYVAINVGVSNFIEPRYMGHSLGLSPLIIIVTMFSWAWVLGPVAMMISIPLTMAVKIILESSEDTHWIAMMMDSEVHKEDYIDQ
jgi:AI-2 transport protein TqsA